ncbi:MAG: tetraacyldisaccharide 4'-kinase [Melioribacteraceae bacterium]|nr:tetraacyldisaccharide 4'-kinase [Melioribacteraceae bacterium]MCF8353503.1 tetraacyldisaccharide 4'-kinase [Melioribacteraceae bacterium]MCF8392632.1 tetraacyldisaccharide 4'-kinase [Melioribacteraceae bacterium]MCF8418496.1 tetraacyldisaccharide 4'-kinase [Melioribacteraceae bacterium]
MSKLVRILLSPTVFVYGFVIKLRNYFFEKQVYKTHKVNAKVISIGNLTVGGSGKTPTVIFVANYLKKKNKKVGILSRGYGRKSRGYKLVFDGNELICDVSTCGDEIILTVEECQVPAAVSEKRVEGAQKFLNDVELDTIILDDAYQHRWIDRDINILVFDQTFLDIAGRMEQKLLPLGYMREPFAETKRADIVIINRKFNERTEIPEKLKKHFEHKQVYHGFYKATGVYDLKTHDFYPVEDFQGQKSLLVCGIARPQSFLNTLKKHHVDVTNKMIFSDHIHYTQKEVQQIRKKFYDTNSYSVLTTHKDAVKLNQFSRELDDVDIYYLKIELELEEREKFDKEISKIYN